MTMLRFMRWVFTGDAHKHIYEISEKKEIFGASGNFKGTIFIQKCKICGKLHNHKVSSNIYN